MNSNEVCLKSKKIKNKTIIFIMILLLLSSITVCIFVFITQPTQKITKPVAILEPIIIEDEISLVLTGDVLLTRLVGQYVKKNGPTFLFGKVKDILSKADIAFTNLESPLGFSGKPYSGKPVNITFRGDPAFAISLYNAGFDIVSLANNHMNDFGGSAVTETITYLNALGIQHIGAGNNKEDAYKPALITKKNITIAFLAFADPIWSVIEANDTSPGVAIIDETKILKAIEDTKQNYQYDYLMISFHWGDEHNHFPNDLQKKIAYLCIENGVDVVIGHHPHVLQGIEYYKNGIIFYSLGNFAFDMTSDYTYQSMIATLKITKSGIKQLEINAVRIDKNTYNPYPAIGEDRKRILSSIKDYSKPFNTLFNDTIDSIINETKILNEN